MQDHLVEIMTRLRLNQHPHIRGRFLFIAIPPAATRVTMVIGGGCIGWQFDFRGSSCGHGGGVEFGFRLHDPQVA
jgi:hypothetical protein